MTKLVSILIIAASLFGNVGVLAENAPEISDLKVRCKGDLEFIRKNIAENSASYANPKDQVSKKWYEEGYAQAQELISDIADKDDCYYALKYYINGFGYSHMSLRSYIKLPKENYPGFLSVKKGDKHIVFFKHPNVSYLNELSIGDEITHIDDMKIADYYKEYILPFYANDKSEISLTASSLHVMLVDGNRFIPIPKNIKYLHNGNERILEPKYTELTDDALKAANKIRQPDPSVKFAVEMVANAVWIKIPSFFLDRSETVFYSGMLSKLKSLAKEDYIVFDLRGNKGGSAEFQRPILRNLWGDEFIKSLGHKHEYNHLWQKSLRISKKNFLDFKNTHNEASVAAYSKAMQKGDKFFMDKWNVMAEDKNLYTNNDSTPIKAKILLLTDNFCRSTCWTFVHEMLQMPNVTHIGAETSIQGPYSYAAKARVPSEDFDFFYPTQIRVYPNDKVGSALMPSIVYKGNYHNEPELLHWVFSDVIE